MPYARLELIVLEDRSLPAPVLLTGIDAGLPSTAAHAAPVVGGNLPGSPSAPASANVAAPEVTDKAVLAPPFLSASDSGGPSVPTEAGSPQAPSSPPTQSGQLPTAGLPGMLGFPMPGPMAPIGGAGLPQGMMMPVDLVFGTPGSLPVGNFPPPPGAGGLPFPTIAPMLGLAATPPWQMPPLQTGMSDTALVPNGFTGTLPKLEIPTVAPTGLAGLPTETKPGLDTSLAPLSDDDKLASAEGLGKHLDAKEPGAKDLSVRADADTLPDQSFVSVMTEVYDMVEA